jgi:limonene-1,2-epoxide hydrolase
MDAESIIRDFTDAWGRGDKQSILDAFTDDAVYHNIPMSPCNGKTEIRTFLDSFLGVITASVKFDIKHQLIDGNIVMNERIDTLELEAGPVALPVCGIFHFTDDGKISEWRDYFDMGHFTGS